MAESRARNRIGSLRQRIAIQTLTKVADGLGGWNETWATTYTVWADMYPLAGTEVYKQGQVESPVTHRAMIRYRTGITTKHRVLYAGLAYNIRAVLNLNERSQWLQLDLESGVAT